MALFTSLRTVIMGGTGHPLFTHLVSTFTAEQGSSSFSLFAGGIHGFHTARRGVGVRRRIGRQNHPGVIIPRHMVGLNADAQPSNRSHNAQNTKPCGRGSRQEHRHQSILVEGNKLGGRSDYQYRRGLGSQLRDSGGFSPRFPRYLLRVTSRGTDLHVLLQTPQAEVQRASHDRRRKRP